jgi:hypothetical protein
MGKAADITKICADHLSSINFSLAVRRRTIHLQALQRASPI